ncbi:metallophosphoesterase, partial [Clostridium butyricum]
MSRYVMSDIHGCYAEFIEMLQKINFGDDDELYVLGDIFDRGPQPL